MGVLAGACAGAAARADPGGAHRLVHLRPVAAVSAARLVAALVRGAAAMPGSCSSPPGTACEMAVGDDGPVGAAGRAGGARRSPGRAAPSARVLDVLFMSPLMLPALAFGFAALMLFTAGRPAGVAADAGARPHRRVRAVRGAHHGRRPAQLDPALLEGSASLGASRLYTFRRVMLPLIRPGILAGAFICFMALVRQHAGLAVPARRRTDMLPIRMWQDLEGKLDVTIAAAVRRADRGHRRADGGDGAPDRTVAADRLRTARTGVSGRPDHRWPAHRQQTDTIQGASMPYTGPVQLQLVSAGRRSSGWPIRM